MAGGRPTKYKKEYCNLLLDHMKQGLSFEAFAGVCEVDKTTLYYWCNNFPEFSNAKKRGEALSRLFWEKMGIAGAAGKLKGFNVAAWCFNMKNRFAWRDRIDIETFEKESRQAKEGKLKKIPQDKLRELSKEAKRNAASG